MYNKNKNNDTKEGRATKRDNTSTGGVINPKDL